MPFAEHCLIETNRWTRSVFRILMQGPATFEEELPAPREALIKAGCAKCREEI